MYVYIYIYINIIITTIDNNDSNNKNGAYHDAPLDVAVGCCWRVARWQSWQPTADAQIFIRHMRNLMQLAVQGSEDFAGRDRNQLKQISTRYRFAKFSPFQAGSLPEQLISLILLPACRRIVQTKTEWEWAWNRLEVPYKAKDLGFREKWAIRDTSFKSQEACAKMLK